MIDYEGYIYFKKDLLKRKTKPYFTGLVAEEYYPVLKVEYPTASIYKCDEKNYCICLDQRARKALLKLLKGKKRDLEQQLTDTEDLIKEVLTSCQNDTKLS